MQSNRRLTTGDVAWYCHVSRATALRWVKDGKIKAYLHPGGRYRVTQGDLVDFLKVHGMPVDEELLEKQEQPAEGGEGLGQR